jgi:methanogenic corrinoid protein MtbC1
MNTMDVSVLVDPYIEHALAGDTRSSVGLAMGLLDAGTPESKIITDLIAPAQRRVGERWHRNLLSVAEEHLATGAAQAVLCALADATHDTETASLVVVACAEGDWHGVAAQMFSEQLRSRGTHVAFLGASTPAEHVAMFMERNRPEALVVSCNLPIFYAGITRLADVAHALGVPVIAGGRSIVGNPERAMRLGADGWANDIDDAVNLLGAWRRRPPPIREGSTTLDPQAVELDARARELAVVAFDDLAHRFPAMAHYDARQLTRTREDLAFIVRFAAAAQLVDDDEVFTTFLEWLVQLLEARDVPAAALIGGLVSLQPHLGRLSGNAGRLASLGCDHLSVAASSRSPL